MDIHPAIGRVIRRFETRAPLTDLDLAAIRALPFTYRTLDAAAYLIREGEPPENCALLLSGFAYRHKVTGEGERQILSVHMTGEFLDMQNSFLDVADHNVQALTRMEVALVPVPALRRLVETHPLVGRAMWIDTLIDSAIFREWIVNVGRRDALSRLAHLLCEFALRLEAAGLAADRRYELPMTQEQLADATGLTAVHINRVLKELGRLGLITRDKRAVEIIDWDRLRSVGDFSARYLHIDGGTPTVLAPAR
ncbi:MAG: Crp/Fnr family transcriptional regulator [Alphaproteobacteria bacterium]|nr:Crp/Fnr family transcriptional regulator [Alphaproteobacteria bacterium]